MTTVGWVDKFSRKAEEHAKWISVPTPMGTRKGVVGFNFPGGFAKALEKWLTNRQQK